MNIKFLSFVAFIFFLSCSSKKESNVQTTTEVTPAPANVETPQTSSGDDIKSLTSFVGKKPSEAQIFDKFDFTKRFEKLMGEHYSEFKSDWNQETPIMKDGEILYFVGCKANACRENKFFVMIDMITNNLNVIHLKDGRPVSHEESAVIGMSEKIAEDFEKTRSSDGL
ncbi:MAG: hypothetical protein WAT26_02110 [Saprospiraceae bacterium]